jgi:hypothetical protein
MREIEVLKNLNYKAREESSPTVDVAFKVMKQVRALREPEEDPSVFRFLEWLTAISSAAAVLAGAMILLSVREWTDPLIALLFEVQ